MILALMIVAGCDRSNMGTPHGLLPLLIFLTLLGLGVALGMQTCKYCVYQWFPWAVKSDGIDFFSICFQSRPWFRSTHPPLFCWVRKGDIQLQKVIGSFYSILFQVWRNLSFQSILALVSDHCTHPWCTSWNRFLWFIPQETGLRVRVGTAVKLSYVWS